MHPSNNHMPQPRSICHIGLLLLLCLMLTSCMATSDWLSAPSDQQSSSVKTSNRFTPIQIGVSTQEEILVTLGNPTDHQIHGIDDVSNRESFAYVTMPTQEVNPFQYLPLFGLWASPEAITSPSAAISFSPQNVVSGLTLSSSNAYGYIPPPNIHAITHSTITFYGMDNPEVSHASANPTSPSR